MSDEMQIASEREKMYQVLMILPVAIAIDAAVLCLAGVAILASSMGSRVLGPDQIWITVAAFTGVLLVGLYYIDKHAVGQYKADGELM